MIGLKRGTVKLCEHEKEWEMEAQNTISRLKKILGSVIKDIQHVGSIHPKHPNLTYPVNYGYIPNVFSGDGEELEMYLPGVDTPVEKYTARIIGIVHHHNDVEDKLVAAPEGRDFVSLEIEEAYAMLTFENTRTLLKETNDFLKG